MDRVDTDARTCFRCRNDRLRASFAAGLTQQIRDATTLREIVDIGGAALDRLAQHPTHGETIQPFHAGLVEVFRDGLLDVLDNCVLEVFGPCDAFLTDAVNLNLIPPGLMVHMLGFVGEAAQIARCVEVNKRLKGVFICVASSGSIFQE